MSKVLKHAVIYTGEETLKDAYLRFDETIIDLGKMSDYQALPTDTEVIDVAGKTIIPGFIDVHSHGGYDFDAMDGDAEALDKMVNEMIYEGVTTYFPTTMTQSHENIAKAMQAIREAAAKNPVIQGIHLEGPFVSPVFKGAQPEEYIEAPDLEVFDQWNKLSGNLIKLVTYAPEHSTSPAFEKYLLEHGIVPSVGHSNATREQMKHSKASHVTHLYNAQREFKHREPGVTGHALLEDNIYCELIADGFHVCPDMIKLAYELKGPDKIELVTDSMRAKGMPEGVSELGGQKVIVKDKQARLETGNLAGSVLRYEDAFKNIIRFTGCSIADAVKMTSGNQAKEFGLVKKGKLAPGMDADLNILDQDLKLVSTYSLGRKFKK
ncbi:N-acetylglucosamine-6-phosphate deacetylase [Ligilactobacillus faecis]|uniref:N-acetylglucosamine-6-phosphate deacetylase n=1 Tax=Ligilactobacillus faecis TaxID=762833 RepID=A0ABV4DS34_9LACO|nr:N-acetylglucosamine-6-phosphate deacetylase [Ligilactobacillus faecis]WGN90506.1 N-acetylglucosamine-6-phosphate deacetylase [Ligilactobacillus faecis]